MSFLIQARDRIKDVYVTTGECGIILKPQILNLTMKLYRFATRCFFLASLLQGANALFGDPIHCHLKVRGVAS